VIHREPAVSVNLASIVLPVYNEADHLAEVVGRYEEALGRMSVSHELLLVPNGCRDRSPEVCDDLAREFSTVRVVPGAVAGWGRSVKAGLRAARGDVLCYTNLARTTAEDLTLLVLYATLNPNAVIKANRKIRESFVRRAGSLLYNLECRALFDLSYWDINGTPKVFPRSFDKLLELSRDDDLIDAEFNVICRQQGYPVLEVPIFSSRRHGGKSTTNFRSAFRMYSRAYDMWRTMKRSAP
jgi:glycosyltransferase involved in cell wall biosynthesis